MNRVTLGDGDWYELNRETMATEDGRPVVTYAACLIDGARGVYAYKRLVEIANDHGAQFGDVHAIDAIDYIDRAEQFLNDQIDTIGADAEARELTMGRVMFGWNDGEFFLANEAWWELAQG